MNANQSTRTPGGLTNAAPGQTLANYGLLDPSWAHTYFNDFDTYVASEWTVTAVGTDTEALTPFDGGALLLTTGAVAADAVYMQLVDASFKIGSQLTPPKDTFFKFSGQLSTASTSTFYAGLIATSATPLAAADGLYIYKAVGAATLALVSVIGGVTTTVPFPASCIITANTPFEVGIHVDTQGNVEAFWNPTTGLNPVGYSQSAAGLASGPVARLTAGATPVVTTALLNVSFGVMTSTALAVALTADYILAARHR